MPPTNMSSASAIIIITFGITVILISGIKPFSQHGGFGLIVLAIVEGKLHRFPLPEDSEHLAVRGVFTVSSTILAV